MTENPFGGEGANPFQNLDLGAMLEQAQQMQAQLMAAQAELASTLVEGAAGGVAVTVTGTGELTGVTISPGAFDSADAESLTDLGDLVVAAFRDAKAKADALAANAMGPVGAALGGSLGGTPGGRDLPSASGGAPLGFGGPPVV